MPANRGDRRIIAQQRYALPITFEPSFELQVKAEKLAVEMRKLTGRQGFIADANKEALEWVKDRAAENLKESMAAHARPQRFSTRKLRGAILANKSHEVTPTGFKFMVRDKVEPVVPYYHALEVGNDYWVGKYVWLAFLGTSADPASRNTEAHMGKAYRYRQRPNITRGNTDKGIRGQTSREKIEGKPGGPLKSDRLVGPRERGAKASLKYAPPGSGADHVNKNKNVIPYRVKIRRPVPAYRYGTRAAEAFLANDMAEYSKALDKTKKDWEKRWQAQLATKNDPVASAANKTKKKTTKKIKPPTGKNTKVGDRAP